MPSPTRVAQRISAPVRVGLVFFIRYLLVMLCALLELLSMKRFVSDVKNSDHETDADDTHGPLCHLPLCWICQLTTDFRVWLPKVYEALSSRQGHKEAGGKERQAKQLRRQVHPSPLINEETRQHGEPREIKDRLRKSRCRLLSE